MGELSNLYWTSFAGVAILAVCLQLFARQREQTKAAASAAAVVNRGGSSQDTKNSVATQRFNSFQNNYIINNFSIWMMYETKN